MAIKTFCRTDTNLGSDQSTVSTPQPNIEPGEYCGHYERLLGLRTKYEVGLPFLGAGGDTRYASSKVLPHQTY